MSNKEHFDYQSRNIEAKQLGGRYFPQGAGAVVNASNRGRGFTVTRTSVGTFAVVFDADYPDVLHVDVRVATAVGLRHAQVISTQTNANGGIIGCTIQIYDPAGAAVELAAAASTWVSLDCILSNTSRPRV